MKIFRWRRLSDEEFVERVRRDLKRARYWAWLPLVSCVLWIGIFIWLMCELFGGVLLVHLIHGRPLADWMNGYQTSFIAGGVSVFVFFQILLRLIRLFGNYVNPRREKLLVAYYDRLNPSAVKN